MDEAPFDLRRVLARAGDRASPDALPRQALREPLPARGRHRRGGRRAHQSGERRQLSQVRRRGRRRTAVAQGRPQPVSRTRRAAGEPAGRGRAAGGRRPGGAQDRRRPRASASRTLTTSSTTCPSSTRSSRVSAPTSRCSARGLRHSPKAIAAAPPPGSCAAVKLLHGLATTDADWLFLPKFVHVPYPNAGPGTYTCPMAQGAPEMVEHALAAEGAAVKVLRPVLLRAEHVDLHAEEFVDELRRMAEAIVAGRGVAGRPAQAAFRAAYEAALARQRRFEEGLRAIGSRALAWARDAGPPGGAHRRRDARAARAGHQLGHPGAGGGQRGGALAGGLLPAAEGRAAAGQAALGECRQRLARRGGGGSKPAACTRCSCVPTAAAPTRSSSTSSTTCWRTTRTRCSRATGTGARPAT